MECHPHPFTPVGSHGIDNKCETEVLKNVGWKGVAFQSPWTGFIEQGENVLVFYREMKINAVLNKMCRRISKFNIFSIEK